MAARCLLVGLVALALARPFIPPGSTIPWMVVLPLLLVAVVDEGQEGDDGQRQASENQAGNDGLLQLFVFAEILILLLGLHVIAFGGDLSSPLLVQAVVEYRSQVFVLVGLLEIF